MREAGMRWGAEAHKLFGDDRYRRRLRLDAASLSKHGADLKGQRVA